MDLQALNSGPTPTQKEWLNPICGSLTAGTVKGGPSLAPAVYSQYSQTSTITVSNTVFGSLTNTATHVGSLTIPPLSVGTVVKITASGSGSSNVGDSINFELDVDGKQATTPTTFGANYGTNTATQIQCYITIGSATASANLMVTASGHSPNGNFQPTITWDRTISHQIDIFMLANVGSLNNGFTCSSFFVELSNAS